MVLAEVSAGQVASEWRAANQDLLGVRTLSFGSSLGSVGGSPIDILLSHRDPKTLERFRELCSCNLQNWD